MAQEVADKTINHQKTLWQIAKLEKEIAARKGGWDPRLDHWTNWDPNNDYQKALLRDLKRAVAGWEDETKDFELRDHMVKIE